MMKRRDETIDILKGMLVFGMILSHVCSLVSSHTSLLLKPMWLLTGLVTFSGFMFSFGYACQLAYFGKDFKASYQRMLMTSLKLLIAFYISGIYWRAFIDKDLSLETVSNILLLQDIPPFSEFLVSFSLVMLVSLMLFQPIQQVTESRKLFCIIFIALLLTTFIPYGFVQSSHLGLLIGTERFPAFPVLQYFPVYLLGVYFAKHRILHDRKVLILSAIGFVGFIIFYLFKHQFPSRFSPSILWILTSILFVYLYYLIARRLSTWRSLADILSSWGRNVLFYLLVSNILIFTFRGAYSPINLNPFVSLGITGLLLFTIHFLTTISAARPVISPIPVEADLLGAELSVANSSKHTRVA